MKERDIFLDRLRVLATCAVVMLHTVTGVMDHADMGAYPLEKKVFLVILDLVCWCVPIFLLISGYLFLHPDRKITFGKMLTKYCRRIVLALFVFGVPYACLEQIAAERTFRLGMVGNAVVMVIRGESWSHLWYLYLILILYLLTPLVKKILEILPHPVLYIFLGVLFIGSSLLPYLAKLTGLDTIPMLPDWGIYLFYYISGSLFVPASADKTCSNGTWRDRETEKTDITGYQSDSSEIEKDSTGHNGNRNKCKYLFIGTVLLATAMAVSRLPGNYTLQMAYNYPFTVALSFLLFAWGNAASRASDQTDEKTEIFWKQAAELSFTVYLVHPVFLNIAYKFLHVTPLSFAIGISVPVFFGLILLLAAALAWLLYQIPLLKKYVL